MVILFIVLLSLVIGVIVCKNLIGSKKVPSSFPGRESSADADWLKKKPLFIKTWSFEEFYKKFDKFQYGNPTNNRTGENFKSCAFHKRGNPVIYVGFYRIPGELSLEELKSRTKELKVGLKENGKYLIYIGDMPYTKESDPINLGL